MTKELQTKYESQRDAAQKLRRQMQAMQDVSDLAHVRRKLQEADRMLHVVTDASQEMMRDIDNLKLWLAGVSSLAGAIMGILFGVMYVG